MCGELKSRRCSGVDSWNAPSEDLKTRSFSGLDLWTVSGWSLKNEEVFWIGLVDRPGILFSIAPRRALKTGRCSQSDQNVLFSYLTQCYYPHTLRESVSPICGIFICKIHSEFNIWKQCWVYFVNKVATQWNIDKINKIHYQIRFLPLIRAIIQKGCICPDIWKAVGVPVYELPQCECEARLVE